jgi:hypothetical protein
MCNNSKINKVKKPQITILQEYQHRGRVHTYIIFTTESSVTVYELQVPIITYNEHIHDNNDDDYDLPELVLNDDEDDL